MTSLTFKNGANVELYRKIQRMTQQQKENLIYRVRRYIQEYEFWETGEGRGYTIGPPPERPSNEEFEIYEQIIIQPQIKLAQSRPVSTAHLKSESNETIKGTIENPMTMGARANIFNFAGPEYIKIGKILQQRKPKFGAESKTKEEIFDKRFPWGGSKNRRRNRRKSKKFIRK
jgi:hypothetical protein